MDLKEKFPVDIDIDLVDLVLTILKRNKPSNYNTIYGSLPLNKKLHEFEFEGVIKMLMEDGYVYLFDGRFYALTVRGHLFWEIGGYRQQNKSVKISERHEHIQTFVLTYGTGAAGLYGIYEILKWLFHHEHWKLFF